MSAVMGPGGPVADAVFGDLAPRTDNLKANGHTPGLATVLIGGDESSARYVGMKMAKAQDMPLTDSRLLGNCGRLKCCLLYEFSTYEELRSRLPRVNSACSADCGGGGCMTGKVRSLRVLKQSVVVGFPDGTEAEVPLDQLTWEGRDHIKPA